MRGHYYKELNSASQSIKRKLLQTFASYLTIFFLIAVAVVVLAYKRFSFNEIEIIKLFLATFIIFFAVALGLFYWLIKVVLQPLEQIIIWAKDSKSLEPISVDLANSKEAEELFNMFNFQVKTLRESIDEDYQLEREQAVLKVARQVAHDVRSPLSALKSLLRSMNQLEEEERLLMKGVVSRIEEIVEELSQQSRNELDPNPDCSSIVLSSAVLERLIYEKRLEFRDRPNIDIVEIEYLGGIDSFIGISVDRLRRVISNLINNSVESIGEEGGIVQVTIQTVNDTVVVRVSDSGCGMSEDVLGRVFERGFSYGKSRDAVVSGSGLGLSYAKEVVEKAGGKIEISSLRGLGTSVDLVFSRIPAPLWFASKIEVDRVKRILILDDDQSVHSLWKYRFRGDQSLEIDSFLNPNEVMGIELNYDLYLVDYEFMNARSVNGVKVIDSLGITDKAILVTSEFTSPDLQDDCERRKLKMLPKSLVGVVPLSSEKILTFKNRDTGLSP